MKTKTMVAGCLLFVTACLLELAIVPRAQAQTAPDTITTTLFEGARLIVGDGTVPIESSAFIVDHGRFTRIGRKGEIQAPAGAARVDLTGKTVMPALIDVHVHAGGATPGLEDRWPTREDYIDFLNLQAYVGIAVVQSLGRDTWAAFQVRAEAPINGARLMTSGRGMTGALGKTEKTIAAGNAGRLPEDLRAFEFQASTPEMARDHIRSQAALGVDCMKIWYNDRGGLEVRMSPAILEAILDEAHRHNIPVYSDSWRLQEFKEAIRAGLDGFAHPLRDQDADDELLQLLKDRPNVVMMTNLGSGGGEAGVVPAYVKDPLFLDIATPEQVKRVIASASRTTSSGPVIHEGWPSDSLEYARERYGIIIRNTKKLYKAGVPYAIGTDGGGFSIHTQMEALVRDVGLTPSQVITMATRDGARSLKLDRELGTVAPSKDASFLVLTANPLDNITNTRRIAEVYLRGHKVDRAGFLAARKQRQMRGSN
jgi:imidazolonepropionase-like amidohydrolase